MSLHAKSCIVVLDNHKDCTSSKSQQYAPILCPDSLRFLVSMAAKQCHTLKQDYVNSLTWLGIWRHWWRQFSTSFVLNLVAMSVFGLKLHMVVIMKALLSLYNIDISTIHEAWNTKELCVFENAASIGHFSWHIFLSQTSTMAAARPIPGSWCPIGLNQGSI